MPPTAPATQANAPSAAPAEPKSTASNIAQGIQNKAAGKAPEKATEPSSDTAEKKQDVAGSDPNAGKRKYTVNGREVWLTPDQADAYVQKGIAFEPKMSELDRTQREMQTFYKSLVENPGKILGLLAKRENIPVQTIVERFLGSTAPSEDVKETIGKWYYENAVKLAHMDPKDRAILERDEQIKSLQQSEKERIETAVALENRAKIQAAMAQLSSQIQETLKDFGLKNMDSPAAVRLAKEIADVMRVSYLSGKPCTSKQAAEKVKARIHEYQREFYDSLDMDQLVEQLGKENAEKVRKHFLKAVQDAEKGTKQEGRQSDRLPKRDERKTMSMDDFHDYLDDLKKTGK